MTTNVLYNEDCLETLGRMLDKVIDLTVTSPPYNLGNDHHIQTAKGRRTFKPYEDDLLESEYQEQQIKVLNELHRVTKDSGSLFYNHKNRIRDGKQITPYEWLLKTDWIIKQELVWFNRSQNFDKIRFYPMTERVYWLVKTPNTKLINTISHHDLFDWKPEGTDKIHKRSFPERMVRDILSCFPNAKIVYDPYMGSGTVARVAKDMGREYIGSEPGCGLFLASLSNSDRGSKLSAEYCNIARQRLRQSTLL